MSHCATAYPGGKMGYTLLLQGRTASYSNTELQWRSPTVCQTLSRWETGIAPGPWGSWSRVRRHLWGDRRCCWGGRPPRSSCSGSTSPGRPPSHTGVWGREKKQFQLLQKRKKKNGCSCFSATLTAETPKTKAPLFCFESGSRAHSSHTCLPPTRNPTPPGHIPAPLELILASDSQELHRLAHFSHQTTKRCSAAAIAVRWRPVPERVNRWRCSEAWEKLTVCVAAGLAARCTGRDRRCCSAFGNVGRWERTWRDKDHIIRTRTEHLAKLREGENLLENLVYLYWAWKSSCTNEPAESGGDGPSRLWSSSSIGGWTHTVCKSDLDV